MLTNPPELDELKSRSFRPSNDGQLRASGGRRLWQMDDCFYRSRQTLSRFGWTLRHLKLEIFSHAFGGDWATPNVVK